MLGRQDFASVATGIARDRASAAGDRALYPVLVGWAAIVLFIDVVPGVDLRLLCALAACVVAGALTGRWWSLLAPLAFAGAVLLFGAVADPGQDQPLGWWDWDDGELFLETGWFGLITTLLLSALIFAAPFALGVGLNRLARRWTS